MKAIFLFENNRSICKGLTLVLCTICISSAHAQHFRPPEKPTTSTYTIAPAAQWTQLFKRHSGWTGGDGIYSIKLPKSFKNQNSNSKKDNILFLFSDSVIDTLVDGQQSNQGFTMIHNAVAILNGLQPDSNTFHFYWTKTEAQKPASVFIPADQKSHTGGSLDDSIYYWLGDGVTLNYDITKGQNRDTALAIFAYKMINTSSEPFGFKDIGNELLFTDDHFRILSRVKIPILSEGNFGAGIYRSDINNKSSKKDPYIYIYGVRGQHKGLVVARTSQKRLTSPEHWQYYTGDQWTENINECKELTAGVSNELSVTQTPNGQYALIFQVDGIQPYIGMKLAPTPYGPFGPVDTLWHCQEPNTTNKLLVYNAKAHPSISPKGTLLISYNVNSFDFLKTLNEDPTFYRPRFLLLKWK